MFIAHQLKQQSMAAYLLYMWRIEDIIRAFNADINSIDRNVIEPMQLNAEQHRQEYEWYESLIDMMHREDVIKAGHIQLVKNILIDLQDCHLRLLQDNKNADYISCYYRLLPAITQLKSKTTNPQISDLEMCFVFLYGIMNLRTQHKDISQETEQTATEITAFVDLLAQRYNTQDIEADDD